MPKDPPTVQVNFSIDAKRLTAAREALAVVSYNNLVAWLDRLGYADILTEFLKSEGYESLSDEAKGRFLHDADVLSLALIRRDFDAGMQGIAEDPPFTTLKHDKAFHVVGGDHLVASFPIAETSFSVAQSLAMSAARALNDIVGAWLDARATTYESAIEQ